AHVDLAGLAHDPAELDQLRGIRPWPGVVPAAGREADRALIESLPDQPARRVERFAPQRRVVEPERLQADRALRNEVGRVDRDLLVVMAAEGGHAAHVELLR